MEYEIQSGVLEDIGSYNTSGMIDVYYSGVEALNFFKISIIILAIILGIVFVVKFFCFKKNTGKCEKDEDYKNWLIKKQFEKLILKLAILIGVSFFVSYIISALTTFTAKPIIYLYPETTEEVSVYLGKPENLTCTYPKYDNGWNVLAEPNGNLIDLKNGRSLYGLYWEGISNSLHNTDEGFCVKGEDTIDFLEEKLEVLGLNEREANEFIIYWLPKLESNKYNYIRFQTVEEINENMPLTIVPTPDSVIRVVMEYKPFAYPIDVKEQELFKPIRDGFVAVEWGGCEL